jgi:glycosyltransferase involved in cell wall biosynthesis
MIISNSGKSWIVFVSTFPSRKCGIATFTEDLANAFDSLFDPGVESKIVAMSDNPEQPYNYDGRVIFEIDQDNPESYKQAAEKLNAQAEVKLVNIQHEFGIFGGNLGKHLLIFLKHLKKPAVITFHTVLPNPDPAMKKIVEQLAHYAKELVVMTNSSYKILRHDYNLPHVPIRVISHGLHAREFTRPDDHKTAVGLEGKKVLATFGFVSRNKGIEHVLDALPAVVQKHPEVVYAVIGATHPTILRKEGESYRNFLTEKVEELGLQNNVKFYNEFMPTAALLDFFKAMDIYLGTSTNTDQAVSGTLTYALGSGRPVISTSFSQAREVITDEVGRIVPIGSPEAYAAALVELLEDEGLTESMGKKAYIATRSMTWPNVAMAYMQLYSYLVPELRATNRHLPSVKLDHLRRLTDDFGIFQFAKHTVPDPSSGYTVDDNARALMVACWYGYANGGPAQDLARIYVDFIAAVQREDGYFENYVNHDKTLNIKKNKKEGLQDPSSRALLGLATAATTKDLDPIVSEAAAAMFRFSLSKGVRFKDLKAAAFYCKALSIWLEQNEDKTAFMALKDSAALLAESYLQHAQPEWQWFGDQLNYSNALLPEALLQASQILGDPKLFEIAESALEFLISQTFLGHIYVPIGQNGWYTKGKARALYDQQPEDPSSMVQALRTVYDLTGKERYKILMRRAFFWFFGNNLPNQILYDEGSGGCYDGLHEHSINLNQGAESTVSYLIARLLVGRPD